MLDTRRAEVHGRGRGLFEDPPYPEQVNRFWRTTASPTHTGAGMVEVDMGLLQLYDEW